MATPDDRLQPERIVSLVRARPGCSTTEFAAELGVDNNPAFYEALLRRSSLGVGQDEQTIGGTTATTRASGSSSIEACPLRLGLTNDKTPTELAPAR